MSKEKEKGKATLFICWSWYSDDSIDLLLLKYNELETKDKDEPKPGCCTWGSP